MPDVDERKVNKNLNILIETNDRLNEIARRTYRTNGQVIDWLVAIAFDELSRIPDETAVAEKLNLIKS